MNYQSYKKHFIYPAFAAILAIALLAMSEEIVKSPAQDGHATVAL